MKNQRWFPIFFFSFLFAGLVLFSHCTEPVTEIGKTFEKDYEYFPLSIGKYMIYDVDSITYRIKNGELIQDSVRFEAKEEIVDTLLDNLGVLNYKIEYFERNDSSEKWQVKKVWRTERDKRQAIRNEEGFRTVKMVFPLIKKKTWNATIFIDEKVEVSIAEQPIFLFKEWQDMKVIDLGKIETIGKIPFEDVLLLQTSVPQTPNLMELRTLEEKYARGVGLVSKNLRILDSYCGGKFENCIDIPWDKKAERGFRLRWTIKKYN
jgi:hypothetical protein